MTFYHVYKRFPASAKPPLLACLHRQSVTDTGLYLKSAEGLYLKSAEDQSLNFKVFVIYHCFNNLAPGVMW